ncbi:MAG TPA: extensin-like protein [Myxococcaceae bacterium]|nr:extensin-like protein [Myxococcaceae bacterium]
MRKAFDQNVSRAKPRVRLGAFAAEVRRLESESPEVPPPEAVEPETVVPPPRKAEANGRAGALRALVEREEPPRVAVPAEAPEVTARVVPPPAPLPVAAPPPSEFEVPRDMAAPPPTRAERNGQDVGARRERLKERLKAVRENPRPEPLPATSAQAGMLAVERIAYLQQEVTQLKGANLSLTQELETARRVAEKATEESRTRMEEATRLASEMEARANLLSELERELGALEGERDEALLALQDARQAIDLGNRERETLRQEIAERQKSLEETLSEEERMAGELEFAQSETASLRRSLDALQAERQMLERQVKDLSAERAELLEARRALESVHRALSHAAAR